MTSYINEIKSIDKEIKRLSIHTSNLKKRKKEVEQNLHNYMKSHNINELEGVKISKLDTKKAPRKKPSEKKRDALALFREVGIPNPDEFWNEFVTTQKVIPEEHTLNTQS